jgi:hypothetical protein
MNADEQISSKMDDVKSASFEQFEEQCIFECYDYNFYHKFTREHKMANKVHSLSDALNSHDEGYTIKHLRQTPNDPTTPETTRMVAITIGHNLLSVCLCSIKFNSCTPSDQIGES